MKNVEFFVAAAVCVASSKSIPIRHGFIEAQTKEKAINELKFLVNWIGNAIPNLQ